jgi:hypothetical protein
MYNFACISKLDLGPLTYYLGRNGGRYFYPAILEQVCLSWNTRFDTCLTESLQGASKRFAEARRVSATRVPVEDWHGWSNSRSNRYPLLLNPIGRVGTKPAPLGLFWFAFTSYPHVHWILPIIGSIFIGLGMMYAFTSVFTFLVVAYRPYAASAMAGNSFIRSAFAAAFPLVTNAMYKNLGVVGASALLAGLTMTMLPLP